MGVQVGDTLVSALLNRGDTVVTRAVTLAPLADEYWVIVTYAGSANGVTTPTAVYEFIKTLSRR